MKKWESQLDDYYALLKSSIENRKDKESQFRFNKLFILASDVAGQYFCEKKVEMQYLHGEIETKEKTMGTEAHEKLLEDTVKIKRRKLWQRIYGKKPVFALEMFLLARYKDVVLVGRPDSVLFQGGYPAIIFEYKFSKSGIAYMTHHVQAGTYGILLRNMGFDTNRLFYAIVIIDPDARRNKELKRKVVDAVIENGPKEAILKIKHAQIHLQKFNEKRAEKDLDWALGFWRNSREAQATNNLNKCKNCAYEMECKKTSDGDLTSF